MRFHITLLVLSAGALLFNSCSPLGPMARQAPEAGSTIAASPPMPDGGNQAAGFARRPVERPGLATGWGDSKKSSLRVVSFDRASSRPAGTDAIYYNDSDGVHAMADAKKKVSAMQPAAGGLVEWGIKGRYGYLKTYESHTHDKRFVMGSHRW